jgi:ABC-type multidrug transport system ATPase subunit
MDKEKIPENELEPIRVMNAKKVYRSGFQAVKGVTFGVPSGECFGLLGPNGAGKTTTINMMCGIHDITEGVIELCGYDLVKDRSSTHTILGVCPQFDCVWDDLTVKEHLSMYATIKGITGKRKPVLIRNVAEMVGLDGDPYMKNASQLSGGMRRRLSIGIALVTDPKVLVLDEPTTGLDPDTRNGLWNCINLAAKSRAVLLTTHSMEEADALCQRIGIMCNGSMTCLGTPLHLKNKFGSGYIITVALDMPMIIKAVLIDIITDNQRKASKDQEEKKECGKSVKKMTNLEVKLYQK